jgi:hypothetical protein
MNGGKLFQEAGKEVQLPDKQIPDLSPQTGGATERKI